MVLTHCHIAYTLSFDDSRKGVSLIHQIAAFFSVVFKKVAAFGQTEGHTWWLIPLSKWVITPVISGLTLLIPFITGVIAHLLSGMSHQVGS